MVFTGGRFFKFEHQLSTFGVYLLRIIVLEILSILHDFLVSRGKTC